VPISNASLYLIYVYNISFIRQIDIIKYFIMRIKVYLMYSIFTGIFLKTEFKKSKETITFSANI